MIICTNKPLSQKQFMPEPVLDLVPLSRLEHVSARIILHTFSVQGTNSEKCSVEIKKYSWGHFYLAVDAKQESFVLWMPRIIFLN